MRDGKFHRRPLNFSTTTASSLRTVPAPRATTTAPAASASSASRRIARRNMAKGGPERAPVPPCLPSRVRELLVLGRLERHEDGVVAAPDQEQHTLTLLELLQCFLVGVLV